MRGAVFAVAALRLQACKHCSSVHDMRAGANSSRQSPSSSGSSQPKDSDDDPDHIASAIDEAEDLFVTGVFSSKIFKILRHIECLDTYMEH
jgi:hypothetical protein